MLQLDDWQKEVLETKGHILLCTGRQVGKTTIFAIKAAEYMVKNPKAQIIVVSLTEDQAQLIIVMTLDYLEKNHAKYLKKAKRATKNGIWLNNGSQILARPVGNTGSAVRGFTGNVLIVDEASRMPDEMWAAAKPTLLTTGGELWLCSTPKGKRGYFYECFLNKDNRFKVFHVNSVDVTKNRAISSVWTMERREGALKRLQEEQKDMTVLQFGQEYLGLFLEDLRQMFPDELIRQVSTKKRREILIKGNYYMGVDVAQMGEDESTFEILDLERDQLIQIENLITKKTHLNETVDLIIELQKKYNLKKIYVDNRGIGAGVFDFLLKESSTAGRVVAIDNAKRSLDRDDKQKKTLLKEDLYSNLLMLMEKGKIRLLDDPEIFLSLKSVQYEYTKDGEIKIFGDYTHIVEGLIRAAWCIKDKSLNLWCEFR